MKFFDFVFAKKIFQYTSESMPMVINDIQLELLAWRDKVAATALDDRTISTPLGRRLQVAKAREDIADIVPAGSTPPLGFQHCFTSIETW